MAALIICTCVLSLLCLIEAGQIYHHRIKPGHPFLNAHIVPFIVMLRPCSVRIQSHVPSVTHAITLACTKSHAPPDACARSHTRLQLYANPINWVPSDSCQLLFACVPIDMCNHLHAHPSASAPICAQIHLSKDPFICGSISCHPFSPTHICADTYLQMYPFPLAPISGDPRLHGYPFTNPSFGACPPWKAHSIAQALILASWASTPRRTDSLTHICSWPHMSRRPH